jgi:hypothetical protein
MTTDRLTVEGLESWRAAFVRSRVGPVRDERTRFVVPVLVGARTEELRV